MTMPMLPPPAARPTVAPAGAASPATGHGPPADAHLAVDGTTDLATGAVGIGPVAGDPDDRGGSFTAILAALVADSGAPAEASGEPLPAETPVAGTAPGDVAATSDVGAPTAAFPAVTTAGPAPVVSDTAADATPSAMPPTPTGHGPDAGSATRPAVADPVLPRTAGAGLVPATPAAPVAQSPVPSTTAGIPNPGRQPAPAVSLPSGFTPVPPAADHPAAPLPGPHVDARTAAPTPGATLTAAPAGGDPAAAALGSAAQPVVPVATAAAPETSPAAPATPASAPASPAQQIALHVTPLRRAPDGVHRMTVHLHPAELGPVSLVAEVRDNGIHLQLAGATETGREALRGALTELRRELQEAGFVNCSLDLREDTPQGGSAFRSDSSAVPAPTGRSEPVASTPIPEPALPRPNGSHQLDLHL